MQTKATNGPSHLFMRVDQSVSYDISRGAGVRFGGMTRDGSTVYFTTVAQLTPDDTDSSADLYMWTEAGRQTDPGLAGQRQRQRRRLPPGLDERLRRRSRSRRTARPDLQQRDQRPGPRRRDGRGKRRHLLLLARAVLDPAASRLSRNERNLYVFRDGEPQFVADVRPGHADRPDAGLPDGSFAAWVTASRTDVLRQRRLQGDVRLRRRNRRSTAPPASRTGDSAPLARRRSETRAGGRS